jgi:hypothetical protein
MVSVSQINHHWRNALVKKFAETPDAIRLIALNRCGTIGNHLSVSFVESRVHGDNIFCKRWNVYRVQSAFTKSFDCLTQYADIDGYLYENMGHFCKQEVVMFIRLIFAAISSGEIQSALNLVRAITFRSHKTLPNGEERPENMPAIPLSGRLQRLLCDVIRACMKSRNVNLLDTIIRFIGENLKFRFDFVREYTSHLDNQSIIFSSVSKLVDECHAPNFSPEFATRLLKIASLKLFNSSTMHQILSNTIDELGIGILSLDGDTLMAICSADIRLLDWHNWHFKPKYVHWRLMENLIRANNANSLQWIYQNIIVPNHCVDSNRPSTMMRIYIESVSSRLYSFDESTAMRQWIMKLLEETNDKFSMMASSFMDMLVMCILVPDVPIDFIMNLFGKWKSFIEQHVECCTDPSNFALVGCVLEYTKSVHSTSIHHCGKKTHRIANHGIFDIVKEIVDRTCRVVSEFTSLGIVMNENLLQKLIASWKKCHFRRSPEPYQCFIPLVLAFRDAKQLVMDQSRLDHYLQVLPSSELLLELEKSRSAAEWSMVIQQLFTTFDHSMEYFPVLQWIGEHRRDLLICHFDNSSLEPWLITSALRSMQEPVIRLLYQLSLFLFNNVCFKWVRPHLSHNLPFDLCGNLKFGYYGNVFMMGDLPLVHAVAHFSRPDPITSFWELVQTVVTKTLEPGLIRWGNFRNPSPSSVNTEFILGCIDFLSAYHCIFNRKDLSKLIKCLGHLPTAQWIEFSHALMTRTSQIPDDRMLEDSKCLINYPT